MEIARLEPDEVARNICGITAEYISIAGFQNKEFNNCYKKNAPVTRRMEALKGKWCAAESTGAPCAEGFCHILAIRIGSLRGPLAGRIGQLPWLHWP